MGFVVIVLCRLMKKDVSVGAGVCVIKASSAATQTHKGRQGNLNNTLSQLLLELSSGSLQPHGKDEYVDKTHWNEGKSPLGLHGCYYGIFRGVTKGRKRKGLKRRVMGIAWLSRGEQGRGCVRLCEC